ncbi:MAG: hypothetical protein A2X28_00800 [Elusimicrobia bacterium GWA2_56_46]|jgi:hypothetical protein|nr:MAG: hypothetical protein A2X28_00800 [Elusimicrobia bacterium GWA2_56_46]OGR55903.1 MAG: hypothetical protein A2X39_06165 [Elusimicrobia bacterium GWC2_56_31]HBB67558.1 hypothetical protein [Elusimicrobiota bacterium]HBW22162.1 hypothetical protein [Elusimicrobiota bacterium]
MAQKSSVIKCQKCGYISNIISDTCFKCGARLEKICGECGFANAVEKNYCDQCGGLLALRAQPAAGPASAAREPEKTVPPSPKEEKRPEKPGFQFEMQPIQDTVSEKEASFRERPPGEIPHEPPQPRSRVITSAPALPERAPASRKTGNIYNALLVAGLLAVLAFFLYLIAAPYIPRFSLKMAADSYLKKLAAGRYEEAYALLSTNSKAACSMKDYVGYSREYYGKIPAWEFRDVEVSAMEPDAAMVKYQLREGTGPWHPDYISFVKEHGKWTRPYIWMLFEPIDQALAGQDYPQALFLAQKLYLTDPLDPRTSGYLCVAEFFMGLYDKSADSCRKTVLSAGTFPVGFSPEEILWYKFYYADSLRFTGKFKSALEEYGDLLGAEGFPLKEQCPIFLSQADAFVQLKMYDSALDVMLRADGICLGDANRGEVVKRLRFMNGDARADAISFAQGTRPGPGLPSFGELRRRELSGTAAGRGPKNARYAPKDNWIAAHLAGPEYRVVLRQETIEPRARQKEVKDIYVFVVNLWTGKVRLERGILPAQNGAGPRK